MERPFVSVKTCLQTVKSCYVPRSGIAMFAKASLILTLVMSLFFSTQVFPVTFPAEMTKGDCAKMQCATGCCANNACCAAMEQHRAPLPLRGTPRADFQLGAVRLLNIAPLYFLPPALPSFVLRDDAHAWHKPPLLAVICVRLI